MSIDRRKLFALGGLGAIGASTGELGPEVDPNYGGAITIRIRKEWTMVGYQWAVLVPDFDLKWGAGQVVPPTKWVPLDQWLAQVDKAGDGTA